MYEGDTRVELQILASLTSDERLRRTAIALFDQSRRNDGLPAMAVPLMEGKDSSTYALCWVMMFGDYAKWGTDPAFLKAHLPGMRATLDGVGLYEDADGLVSNLPGWNYVDERLGNYGVPPGGLPNEPPGALRRTLGVSVCSSTRGAGFQPLETCIYCVTSFHLTTTPLPWSQNTESAGCSTSCSAS